MGAGTVCVAYLTLQASKAIAPPAAASSRPGRSRSTATTLRQTLPGKKTDLLLEEHVARHRLDAFDQGVPLSAVLTCPELATTIGLAQTQGAELPLAWTQAKV